MSNGNAGNCSAKGKEVAMLNPSQGRAVVEQKVMTQANYRHIYPEPLAKYKDVVDNQELFMNTLGKVHAVMGTKFMIPTIGGRELDLHRLFVEVTSRGGIEKVIGDRRWREVTAVFSFPSTATNASFVLRKYYMSLLHHYEQIYFFRSQGWNSPPTTYTPSATSVPPEKSIEPLAHSSNLLGKRRSNGESAPTGPSASTSRSVIGVIDGKFEHGYFVSVMIGTQKLKGVLYHTAEPTAVDSAGFADSTKVVRRRRRRKKLSKRDPTHPKPNRSGYNFFFAEQHARLKPLHPGKDREISKMIGDLWNRLTETEKAIYQEKGVKDKERYRSELAVYKERQILGQVIRNAVPIQQRPADPGLAMEGASTKMLIDEDDLPCANPNDSSSDDSIDSEEEEKKSDEDSEPETFPDIAGGGTGTESASLAADPSNEGDDFELRRRDVPLAGAEADLLPSSSEDAESKKGGGPSVGQQ
ncbi:high mobility group B protein 15-like [Iris pallida]|uniref:High mobility group B protein 15-like n=1 Tax=Iris pallida TaxID=29817 RepID=A0AAX6EZH6_IRIPA|nr:high mobility group B protein 15-like [Iris pallida]